MVINLTLFCSIHYHNSQVHELSLEGMLLVTGLHIAFVSHHNKIKGSIHCIRTSFDSNPKQEWTQAQKARTINL